MIRAIRAPDNRRKARSRTNDKAKLVRKMPSDHQDKKSSGSGGSGDEIAGSTLCFSDEDIRLMPFLFDIMDVDSSGSLDRAEIILGCVRKIKNKGIEITEGNLRDINTFMSEADTNNDDHLDRREFGTFLLRLASLMGLPLEKVATALIDDGQKFQTLGWDLIPELFTQWDSDRSGTISRHEISLALRHFKLDATFAQCMAMMQEVDSNCDSQLDQKEFAAFLARYSLASGIPLMECVEFLLEETKSFREVDLALEGWKMMPLLFDQWDSDNNGVIDRAELVEGMGNLIKDGGLSHVDLAVVYDIMGEVDTDRNQLLDRREFGFFLSRFAVAAKVSLDEVAYYLREHKKKTRAYMSETKVKLADMASSSKGWSNCDKVFHMLDINNDGYVDHDELWTIINRLRCKNKEVKIPSIECLKIIEQADADNDCVLNPREFSAFVARLALITGLELEELTNFLADEIKSTSSTKKPWESMKLLLANLDRKLSEESIETIRQLEQQRAQSKIKRYSGRTA